MKLSFLRKRLRKFAGDTEGTIIVDAILILPLFLWAYLSMFDVWSAFRVQNVSIKASYTVSDLISRETGTLTPEYINGLAELYKFLLANDPDTSLRVTSVRWLQSTNKYVVLWSHATNDFTPHTTATNANETARLPIMTDGETGIIVETRMHFNPAFNMGPDPHTYDEFLVTRPRFVPKIDFSTGNSFSG